MIEVIDIFGIRIILALIMLSIATGMDLWKREIHDWLWIGFAGIAIILLLFEPDIMQFILETGWALIISPFVVLAWRFGLFGGADAFVLIVLALLVPQITFSDNNTWPLTTLTNAVVLSIIPMIIFAIKNCIAISKHEDIFSGFDETKLKKTAAIFIGYKAKNPKFGFTIERTDGNKKKLDFSFNHAERDAFSEQTNSWITPGLPFLIFIFGGFLIQLFYGDLILGLFSLIQS